MPPKKTPAAAPAKAAKPKEDKPKEEKKAKAPEPKPAAKKPANQKDWKTQHPHLFASKARDFRIGRNVQPKRDLSRYVKWPRYIRIQRQRAILKQRIKVPPAIHQFSRTLDKNQATTLFKLLAKYQPESREQKKKRLLEEAQKQVKEESAEQKAQRKPKVLKFGINHVTTLVETKKAKLVIIAHDVEPIELVVWLPALCRKLDIPYCIVKSKARLGHLVHQKTATVLALTEVTKEDGNSLQQLAGNFRAQYNDEAAHKKKWGGGVMGIKAQARERLRAKARAKEAAKSSHA